MFGGENSMMDGQCIVRVSGISISNIAVVNNSHTAALKVSLPLTSNTVYIMILRVDGIIQSL